MASNLIRLGNNCNERCLFCTVAYDNEKELTHKEVKEKIAFIKEKGGKSITFTGGEPTIRDDLPELIKYAKSLDLFTELQTNGVRLSDKVFSDKIIKSGIDVIVFSFHSHKKEIFDRLTDLDGSFTKAMKGIENVSGKVEIQISHVINSLNYRDTVDFVKFMKEKFPEINFFYFGFIRPNGRTQENKWLVPKISEIDLHLYKLFNFCKQNKIAFAVEGLPLCYMQGFEEYCAETQRLLSKPVFYIGSNDVKEDAHKDVIEKNKSKSSVCNHCFLNEICAGLWREYAEMYGLEELFPIFEKKEKIIEKIKGHHK